MFVYNFGVKFKLLNLGNDTFLGEDISECLNKNGCGPLSTVRNLGKFAGCALRHELRVDEKIIGSVSTI